jgi:hypothetical protein
MNDTALHHPLVRDYLRALDSDCAVLPASYARELREQIRAHLDEALGPEAGEYEVAETLRQLGSPRNLVAEAAATAGKRPWLARLTWRGWLIIVAAAIVVVGVPGYVTFAETRAPLTVGGGSWWFARDARQSVVTSADNAAQVTAPVRSGQEQGFYVFLFNPSGQTQTVLGVAAGYGQSPAQSRVHISLSVMNPYFTHGAAPQALRYRLPVSIPPGQTRYLRVLWLSRGCIEKGGEEGLDTMVLRVRVGLITRTETVPLTRDYALGAGTPCTDGRRP